MDGMYTMDYMEKGETSGRSISYVSTCLTGRSSLLGAPVELPELAERPTVRGRGRWEGKAEAPPQGESVPSLPALLVRLCTGPKQNVIIHPILLD